MDVRTTLPTRSAATDLASALPFVIGPLDVDPPARRVSAGERSEKVEPRAMRVLVALGEIPGRVVSRDELIELCWDGQIVTDNAVTRVISLLRHAFSDLAGDAVKVETIAKVGFRLVVDGQAAEAPPKLGSDAPAKRHPWRRWPLLLLALLAVVGAAIAGWVALHPGVDRTAALIAWAKAQPALAGAAKPADQPRIAVLAFQPADDSNDAKLVADGLSADVASALSQYDVTVIASASSLQIPPVLKPKAGALLGADFLIDGRISGDNGKLTVSAQLSDARKNILIASFDTQQREALGSDVAKQIASHLTLALNPTKVSNTLGKKTTPEDYALMARINAGLEKWDIVNVMDLYRQLAARHPDDAELQATMSSVTIIALPNLPEGQQRDLLRSARAAIRRAEKLDPYSGLVMFGKEVLIHFQPMQLPEREALLRRTLELSPNLPHGHDRLGRTMGDVGRAEESIRYLRRAVQLHPLSALHAMDAATYYVALGDISDARQIMEKAKVLWPDQPAFAYQQFGIDFYTGNFKHVVELRKKLPFLVNLMRPDKEHSDLLMQALITRDQKLFQRAVENCFLDFPNGINQGIDGGCLKSMVRMGALDDAFRFADIAFPDNRTLYPPQDDRWLTRRLPGLDLVVLFDPNMAPFRDDPRFWPVAVRAGLVNYWQKTQKWPDFCVNQLDKCKALAATAAQANPPHVASGLH